MPEVGLASLAEHCSIVAVTLTKQQLPAAGRGSRADWGRRQGGQCREGPGAPGGALLHRSGHAGRARLPGSAARGGALCRACRQGRQSGGCNR